MSQRERLDQIWRIFAQFILLNGLVMLVFGAVFLHDFAQYIARTIAFSAFLLVIGVIDGWPNFRIRAQAYLSSMGESRSLAAAVAAAIGDYSVEEVLAFFSNRLLVA